jgi:hypothetical protein
MAQNYKKVIYAQADDSHASKSKATKAAQYTRTVATIAQEQHAFV